MRIYNATSNTVLLARKLGYFMSPGVCVRVVRSLSNVLQLTKEQERVISNCFQFGFTDSRREAARLSPAEERAVEGFLDWYTVDSVAEFRKNSYVVANLNTGGCVTFVAIRTRHLEYIDFQNGRHTTKWVPATEHDVLSVTDESPSFANLALVGETPLVMDANQQWLDVVSRRARMFDAEKFQRLASANQTSFFRDLRAMDEETFTSTYASWMTPKA